jgi:hypothetical protein
MNIKNAVGTRGFILDTIGGYVFRVYHDKGGFTDYDLRHGDLEVTIVDEDAYFYPNDKEGGTLDYSPQTQGLDIK